MTPCRRRSFHERLVLVELKICHDKMTYVIVSTPPSLVLSLTSLVAARVRSCLRVPRPCASHPPARALTHDRHLLPTRALVVPVYKYDEQASPLAIYFMSPILT